MSVTGQQVVDYLMQYKGTPYQWGGDNPDTNFDCSGLLQWGFKHFGISIPRVTYDQIGYGKSISMDDLQVGDAVFFDTEPGTPGPDHVGIYIGNGKMLHAPHTGDVVKISDITSGYFAQHFMGGRRFNGVIGGGSGGNDTETGPADSKTPEQTKLSPEELASQYGWAYAFLNSDSSLKSLFQQAVDGNWTSEKFQAQLRQTDFWKNNSDVARKALEQKAVDPASWNATIQANTMKIQEMAAQVGAAIPNGQLGSLAEQMAMTGMGDEQLKNILGGWVDFTSNNTMNGTAGMVEHSMRQYADQQGVGLSSDSIKSYAQMFVKGLGTQDDFKNFIDQQAISEYPGWEQQIKAGGTMKQIANPYIQTMAQTLGLSPDSISLSDPTIKAALNGLDVNGNPVGKSLVDFEDSLRGDPRYRYTPQAMDKTMAVGNSVLKSMGLVG